MVTYPELGSRANVPQTLQTTLKKGGLKSRQRSPSNCPPGNSRVGEGRMADGEVWRITLQKENKKPPISSVVLCSLS